MSTATSLSGEHAEDVLGRLLEWRATDQKCALVIVTSTQGGSVRAPGALMAVSELDSVGYISGGCIDADVELQARAACENNKARSLRYGAGSPFVDLPLPCGGAIEILIIPMPNEQLIQDAYAALQDRRSVALIVNETGDLQIGSDNLSVGRDEHVFTYSPKLRVRMAGRGADTLALAKICHSAGYWTKLQLVDDEDILQAKSSEPFDIEKLETPARLPAADDDEWTAFVLLFHDSDWEVPLLKQALDGSAFYVGAVGSQRTHAKRCAALRDAGCSKSQIDRVYGPIGLVPSIRDASMLAISILAEIVGAFPGKSSSRKPRTALVLLAAGASSRFEDGDKLLAELDGRTVLDWSASRTPSDDDLIRIAVVPTGATERRNILRKHGWEIVDNPNAADGQATSVKCGIEAGAQRADVDQIIILLADMPFVPASHLDLLRRVAEDTPTCSALMTESGGVLSPPALFKREHFSALTELSGDQGAKSVFLKLGQGSMTCQLAKDFTVDIDNAADMARVKEATHA